MCIIEKWTICDWRLLLKTVPANTHSSKTFQTNDPHRIDARRVFHLSIYGLYFHCCVVVVCECAKWFIGFSFVIVLWFCNRDDDDADTDGDYCIRSASANRHQFPTMLFEIVHCAHWTIEHTHNIQNSIHSIPYEPFDIYLKKKSC